MIENRSWGRLAHPCAGVRMNMLRSDETKFVLHGLDLDNRIVRATVFVQKLRSLLSALQTADKVANGKPAFDYVLSDLRIGSASVTIREKQKTREQPRHSSISALENAASAIYNGDRSLGRLPPTLVQHVRKLGQGVAKKFSHAELAFSDDNVIRIDDFLLKQSSIAYETLTIPNLRARDTFFRGLAIGSFDGVLKEIDARGTMLRGKLVLSAGGLEIDCVMNKDRVPEARESFDKRVAIEGTAHYDGVSQLPVRLDVRSIKIIHPDADLIRWRGAFRLDQADDVEDDW
jgi:hypothetical protein